MRKTSTRTLLALAAMATAGISAAAYASYGELSNTRADAVSAWQAIGVIHSAREMTAQQTLASAGKMQELAAADVDRARAMLSQVRALPPAPALLDDPQAIDTYKRYQGELSGALFGLAFGAQSPAGAAAVDMLRSALPRNEAALAQARMRYREAASKHNAIAATLPGSLVGKITGQGPVPPEL